MQEFTVLTGQLFCYTTKGVLLNCILISYPKYFMLGKKAPCNGRNLNLKKAF